MLFHVFTKSRLADFDWSLAKFFQLSIVKPKPKPKPKPNLLLHVSPHPKDTHNLLSQSKLRRMLVADAKQRKTNLGTLHLVLVPFAIG